MGNGTGIFTYTFTVKITTNVGKKHIHIDPMGKPWPQHSELWSCNWECRSIWLDTPLVPSDCRTFKEANRTGGTEQEEKRSIFYIWQSLLQAKCWQATCCKCKVTITWDLDEWAFMWVEPTTLARSNTSRIRQWMAVCIIPLVELKVVQFSTHVIT